MSILAKLFRQRSSSTPNLPSGDQTAPRRSKYWQCQACGTVFPKEDQELYEGYLEAGSDITGGRTCNNANCGARHQSTDIYRGAFDMRAPDELIANAFQDKANTHWNSEKRVWLHKNQELRGSERFEVAKGGRPSNVKHTYAKDGKLLYSMLAVDQYHLSNADAKEVEEILASIATQIREGGSFRPCLVTFIGYDDDPRAICEIPEIRRWCAAAWKEFPALVAVLDRSVSNLSRMFVWCLIGIEVSGHERGKANFKISIQEQNKIVQEAERAVTQFLQACGYSDATKYALDWNKSMNEGLVSS